jgi:hypothetical protein
MDEVTSHLSSTGGSDVKVKLACPCIDKNDVPLTDFGKLSRSFIAYVHEGPMLTFGMPIAEAYEAILEQCIEHEMTHVVIVESDVIAPKEALARLMVRSVFEGHPFVCASYPFKDGSGQGVVALFDDKGRTIHDHRPFERRGLVPAGKALPMGCCVIDLRIAAALPRPWFKNGWIVTNVDTGEPESTTQDTYFTTRMVLAGHKPVLDTDIQCVHVCRETRRCFGSPDYVRDGRLRPDAVKLLAIRNESVEKSSSPWSKVKFVGAVASDVPGLLLVRGEDEHGGQVLMEATAEELAALGRMAEVLGRKPE